jgi:hypothetical protein
LRIAIANISSLIFTINFANVNMAQMNMYIKVIDIHGCQSASSANHADSHIWQYSAVNMLLLLALATLGDVTKIEPILFVLCHLLWSRQVSQAFLWCKTADYFARNVCQCI